MEPILAVRAPTTTHKLHEVAQLLLGREDLGVARRELQLVAELRQRAVDDVLDRHVRLGGRRVGRTNGEDVRDELGVPQRDAVDDSSAPVVATQDDLGGVELARQLSDVVRGALEAVERDIGLRGDTRSVLENWSKLGLFTVQRKPFESSL